MRHWIVGRGGGRSLKALRSSAVFTGGERYLAKLHQTGGFVLHLGRARRRRFRHEEIERSGLARRLRRRFLERTGRVGQLRLGWLLALRQQRPRRDLFARPARPRRIILVILTLARPPRRNHQRL